MHPLVSIIIPCFNYGQYLQETLDNIKSQEFDDWECIIVDDGSTDTTAEVADKFIRSDKRFRYYYQTNSGPSAARNRGLNLAVGTFIQFLDADDFISTHKLLYQTEFMLRHPKIGISYTDAFYFFSERPDVRYGTFYFDDDGKIQVGVAHRIPQIDAEGITLLRHLVIGNIAPIHCMLTRKAIIDEVGGFDETYRAMEDWDFWLRCAFQGAWFSFFDHQDAYASVRLHSDSASNNMFEMSLQHFRRLKQSKAEIKRRQLPDLDFLISSHDHGLSKINLRRLIHKAGYFNIKNLTRVAEIVGWSSFFKNYLSVLNRYRKGKR